MKIVFLIIIAVFCQYNISIAQTKAGVNECIELTNIVFRLTEIPVYLDNNAESYSHDIDTYFAKYKSHELIRYVKSIKEEHNTTYEMIPKVIACLEVKNGRIVLRESVDVFNLVNNHSQQEIFTRYIELLNNFYKKTNFRQFYNSQIKLYATVNERINALLCDVNPNWFESFFNQKSGNPIIVVSPSNGRYNYAIPDLPDTDHNMIIIIGNSRFDSDGLPIYDDMTYFSIIHELMHGYTNVRMEQMWEQFESAISNIYPHVQNSMYAIGYNDPETMATEWLNNLFTLLYLKNNGQQDTSNFLIRILEGNGFIWMERSLKFMEYFYDNKDIFPNIDAFMFQFVGFVDNISKNIEQIKQEVINKRPYIVDTFPASESVVSLNTDKIIFRFSVPMMSNSYGIGALPDKQILNLYPIIKNAFWQNDYTFVLTFDSAKLEKGTEYGIILKQYSFQSTTFYSLETDYLYQFKTENLR